MDTKKIDQAIAEAQRQRKFSGAFCVAMNDETLSRGYGYANRADGIKNCSDTKFAIASGCKIFTAAAICMLVQQQKISFNTRVEDCLDIVFPAFSEGITIHQLLTHTAGIPDYFDEEEMDDYEVLWQTMPMYHIRKPADFLPLFQRKAMLSNPGSSFHYNNAGYIILGIIVEQVTGHSFASFVEKYIFQPAGMKDSGYFETDRLPKKAALGYIKGLDGTYRSNVFSLPAKGGPDGGAYVTVGDMVIFWQALLRDQLLSKRMREVFLDPQVTVEDDICYGYSGYMQIQEQGIVKHILMGYDPGVNFRAVYYPNTGLTVIVCSNQSDGAYELLKEIENIMLD